MIITVDIVDRCIICQDMFDEIIR